MPRATAPRPTALAAAPPVLWAGPELVADAAPEARDAADEAAELAAEAADERALATAELAMEAALETAMEADEAAEATAELAMEAAMEVPEGTATEIPAALQTPARAGATSVRELALSWSSLFIIRTSSVIGRAAAGDAGCERAGDGGLASGALAGHIGDTAARAGDGSDETSNLQMIRMSTQLSGEQNIQRSQGPARDRETGQRRRRAKSRTQRWWRNAC